MIGIDTSDAVQVSAKTGAGIDDLLEAMVKRLPAPTGDRNAPLKALLVDSWYDPYLGVVTLVRVKDGVLKKGMRIRMMAAAAAYDLDKVGIFAPKATDAAELGPGEIGFIIAGIKTIADCKVGDTITDDRKPAAEMLAGFKPSVPVVFCGLFPADAAEFETLRESLSKLRLNDSSFHFEPESSAALGFGFRCGFLGLLHLEIVQERLEREFNLDLVTTAPSVVYKVRMTDGTEMELHNPADYPDPVKIADDAGAVDQGHDHHARRAPRLSADALPGPPRPADRTHLCRHARHGDLPPAAQRGGVRLLRPAEVGDARLCQLRLRDRGLRAGRAGEARHPGQCRAGRCAQHDRPQEPGRSARPCTVRAAEGPDSAPALQDRHPGRDRRAGDRARDDRSPMRKDVLAKCYGGDISRKKKLLEKQKKGKKRMRQIGEVEIPQSAFIAALKMDVR